MRPSWLILLVTAFLAAVVTACVGMDDQQEEIAQLREEVESRAGAERALAGRIDELEAELVVLQDANEQDPTGERLDAVDEELARLADVVAGLEADLAAEAGDRAALGEELRTNVSDLRSTLVELEGGVDEIRGQVDELRALYTSLRDRLDRLQRSG